MAATRAQYEAAWRAGAAKKDLPPHLAAMADADPLIDQAHDAGRNGADFDEWHAANRPAPAPAPSTGRRAPARSPRRPVHLSRPSLRRPLGGATGGGGPVRSTAGVLLGFIAYALALSVVDYGVKGPLYWFKAKFLNEPAPAKAS